MLAEAPWLIAAVGGTGLLAWLLALLLRPARRCSTSRCTPREGIRWQDRPDLGCSARRDAPATHKSYLVIGTGCVGSRIMEALLQRGETRVKGFDLAQPRCRPRSDSAAVSPEFVQGSVTDLEAVREACIGVDVVFVTMALIRFYERLDWQYAESHAVNVEGTHNVIQACVDCGVKVLVQTSSSNVCVSTCSASLQMDEECAYVDAATSPNHYSWTKAQAEKAVLAAHGRELPGGRGRLATGACRPCSGIFGHNDNLNTEGYIRNGHLQLVVTEPILDYIFVDNVVWGHLLLEKNLHINPQRVGGEAFCISNEDPMNINDFFLLLAFFYEQALRRPMRVTYLPQRLMRVLGWCCEAYQRLCGRRVSHDLVKLSPPMWKIAELSYIFSSKKARRMLGYEPLYTVEEGLQKTMSDWMEHSAGNAPC